MKEETNKGKEEVINEMKKNMIAEDGKIIKYDSRY